MTDRERLLELAEAVVGVHSMLGAGFAIGLAESAISDDELDKIARNQGWDYVPTDRERHVGLAEAVVSYLSNEYLGSKRPHECSRVLHLAQASLLSEGSLPAEEVFEELDKESHEWDNEGGQ